MNNGYISPNTGTKFFDLTKSQSLIWIGQQLNPDSPMYNMAFTFEWNQTINEVVFQKAFSHLIQQSDAMRTVIEIRETNPQQIIFDKFDYVLEVLDFSEKDNKTVFLKEWVKNRSQKIFDLSKCLFDAVLIKMEDDHYIWFLNQHHLITDGWSKTVQYKKMMALYQANDQPEEQLPLFEEYIKYEQLKRTEKIAEASVAYWQQISKRLTELPTFFGKTNPAGNSQSNRTGFRLSDEKTQALKALTKQQELRAWTEDLSLFNIFSTLLFAATFQLTGQQNLAIGIPVPNRPKNTFKNTPGLFTELFPLVTNISSKDTFITLFEKVRNESFECLKHAGSGSSSADLSKGFNVVLNYMNGNFDTPDGIPMNPEWVFVGHADPGHHLRLQIFDFNNEGTIDFQFDFNTSVFNLEEQAILIDQFSDMLDRFIKDRTQLINHVSKAEQDFLLSLNNPAIAYPKDKTIVDLFEEQVQKYPDKIALVFENKKISYRTLNEQANQLANYLRTQGVKEEMLIGLCVDRSPAMIKGILAIIKAGGTYVPIDPSYPENRIHYMIKDAKLAWMISESRYRNLFSEGQMQVIDLDVDSATIAQESITTPSMNLRSDNGLYVIYTSGSTGKPKGVVIEHKNVVRLFFHEQPLFDFNENDTWTLFHSFCFDFSVWEMYGALLFGGTLVIVPKDITKDPEAYTRLLVDQQVTILNQTPRSFYNLQNFYIPQNKQTSIRYVIFGGEALAPNLLLNWKTAYPNSHLINMYGITETTVHVTYREITDQDIETGVSNIGKAIPTLECLILDEEKKLVPRGRKGEIYVGGAGLARGYLGRPLLTEERFIPHPINGSGKLYKTGDLGMRLADGTIKYMGRLDDQVKIRGHRIELGEIETAINQHKSVSQTVVVAKENKGGDKQLIAYITSNEMVEQQELLSYLEQQLPVFMIPAIVVRLEKFPLTVNGKVDKSALPAPDFNASQSEHELVEARNEFEEIISEIWSDILEIERIDVYKDFFRLGGDSISGVRIMARINDAFELELPVNLIFKASTVYHLSVHIENTIRQLLMEMDGEDPESL